MTDADVVRQRLGALRSYTGVLRRLAHGTTKEELERNYRVMEFLDRLDDFEAFAASVTAFLERPE